MNPGFLFIPLHPHLSVLNIVIDGIQNFRCIRDAHNLEFHVPEHDREKDIFLPGDEDGAFVDWGADFEADAIVIEEYEFGGVPTYF